MKHLLTLIFLLLWLLELDAQQGMYRRMPQINLQSFPSLIVDYYGGWGIKEPIKTQDGGYVFSYFRYGGQLHSFGGAFACAIIKTDSTFTPEWKMSNYGSCVSLPTGGIVLFTNNTIEKVTRSGIQVWKKSLPGLIVLNDAVVYGNKVRFVGKKSGTATIPFIIPGNYPTSEAYSVVLDTSGSFVSDVYLNTNFTVNHPSFTTHTIVANIDPTKVERDPQGNFYLYTAMHGIFSPVSNVSIAKFDSSFNFIWGKRFGGINSTIMITDVEMLPNGRILASGMENQAGVILKLSPQGDILTQKSFSNRRIISGLCKKNNGNYILSNNWADSLFIFEIDTSMNVLWHKHFTRGTMAAKSLIKGNVLYTNLFCDSNLVVVSTDLNGSSCSSYPSSVTQITTSFTTQTFTLTSTSPSLSISTATGSMISMQSYSDSCNCPVSIPINQSKLCIGNTGTIGIIGTGNLSWYSTATGNSFIQSGSQFIYSSNTPTSLTIYAQDSACVLNPIRTPINITVYGPPTLTLSAWTPTLCKGNSTLIFASGANTYTWNNFNTTGYSAYVTPTATAVYTVTGELALGCSDTQTIQITVVPGPTISVTPSSTTICAGSTVNIVASGATSYTWPGIAVNTPSINASIPWATFNIYSVVGSNGFCTATGNATLTTLQSPNITIIGTQSLCSGFASTLVASGATTYTWSTSSNSSSIVVTPSSSSVYTVHGSLQNGCQNTQTITVSVTPTPTILLSSSATSVCIGDSVGFFASGASSYSWNNGVTASSFTSAVPPGISTYTLSGSNGSCASTATIKVYGSPVPSLGINVSPYPGVVCLGKTYTITAYTWSWGLSSFTLNNSSVSNHTIVTPTSDFDLIVRGENYGCANTGTFNLVVHPNPTITVAQSQNTMCSGQSFVAMASGASQYNWNDIYYLPSTNILTLSPNMSTVYYVVGYNSFGCSSDTVNISITVHQPPKLNVALIDSVICSGETTTLTANGAYTYSWSTSQTSSSISVSPLSSTIYTVVGTSAVGCVKTATVMQLVDLCTGMNGISHDFSISVYPNPGSSKFYGNLSNINSETHFEIYNSVGQLILKNKITAPSFSFDMSGYSSGVYYMKITDARSSYLHKILKQ